MTIGDKIKELRRKRNMSQTDLGNLAGVHYSHIGKYENNQQVPSTETLKKIANVFEVPIDYLLDDDSTNSIKVSFQDEDLLRDFKAIEQMPEDDKRTIKELINAFIVKNQIKQLVK
jgi:transcriptional regulator with XRE-family HTH domain